MAELDFSAHYRVDGYEGVAWALYGYIQENQWNEEFEEWDTIIDYSQVRAVMVGDDREHEIDVDDLTVIAEDEFCRDCGQIGCGHNTYK